MYSLPQLHKVIKDEGQLPFHNEA